MSAKTENISPRFEIDIEKIYALHTDFCLKLGLTVDPSDLSNRSYHPVTDRWHIEALRKSGDIQGLFQFRNEMFSNLRTNLMERFLVNESVGRMLIKDGRLYSENFPKEPFAEVIARGIEYRELNGSNELERELAELAGFRYIENVMLNADVGTTVISFSPPSKILGSPYKFRFVDTCTVRGENGERFIERKRMAVNWSEKDYKNNAVRIDPSYFEDYDGRSIDAWFLSHPTIADSDTIAKIDGSMDDGMNEFDFKILFEDPMLQRLLDYYAVEISAQSVNWENVALAFNAILNHGDKLKLALINKRDRTRRTPSYSDDNYGSVNIGAYINTLGRQAVATTIGGGCPPNKGISWGGLLGGSIFGSNSVSQFSGLGLEEKQGFNCPSCGDWIPWGSGNSCPHCGITKQKYGEKTGKPVC